MALRGFGLFVLLVAAVTCLAGASEGSLSDEDSADVELGARIEEMEATMRRNEATIQEYQTRIQEYEAHNSHVRTAVHNLKKGLAVAESPPFSRKLLGSAATAVPTPAPTAGKNIPTNPAKCACPASGECNNNQEVVRHSLSHLSYSLAVTCWLDFASRIR